MEVLKIATAGSVDDGKSTLIGRLLNDTKSLTTDKLIAIERKSKQKGYDYIDFSLITDGLIAEREQGITIDVAHIYFSTNTKSYIIADTPGHLEYTRNMVTGASTSQASIILIDARKGVTEQTKRHFFINDLLRVEHVIVAINKMDLVEYDENAFLNVMSGFKSLIDRRVYKSQKITFIPVCALHGDNIVNGSKVMNWYNGPTLITYLELLEMEDNNQNERIRFPVQYIIRPKTEKYHDFRGYAGKLYGGQLNVGDPIVVLPSFKKSKIKDIYFYNEKYESASKDSSVNITLEDEININRGDMIVKEQNLPFVSKNLTAIITWMDREKLIEGKKYIIQHGVNKVLALVEKIHHKVYTNYTGIKEGTEELEMNDIGKVTFKLNKPLFYDTFENHKSNGVFILIDRQTNSTVGVGFIEKFTSVSRQ